MKFLADENVPKSIVNALRTQRYDVKYAAEQMPRGATDGYILRLAREEKRTLITNDKDLILLAIAMNFKNGIILLRLGKQQPNELATKIVKIIHKIEKNINNSTVIISEEGFRIKRLKQK